MQPCALLVLFALLYLFSQTLALGIPISVPNTLTLPNTTNTDGSNPLPPAPPKPPIGPDNWPISGTDLTLKVQRPYGAPLPYNPTIFCLVSAQSDLDRQITIKGDVIIDYSYTFQEGGIKVYIQTVDRRNMVLSKASNSLRGVVQLMTVYPELGTKAVQVIVTEPGVVLTRVVISASRAGVDGKAAISLNGTTLNVPATNLTALDPENYRVPDTTTTVALEGKPPYGSPLPKENLILALASAQGIAAERIQKYGDDALPGLWRFEEFGMGIDVYTHPSVDCHYSTLENGLLGLVDLVNEPGGVGAVAADFNFQEDGKGEVASGRLKLLSAVEDAVASGTVAPSATLIEQGATASVTLVGGTVATDAVEIA
ncbi:hypothetical protein MMC28_008118 [Mycoblastus sanguinarius]|nr:hypothetical protein [Mycoblastus sanguinarius]